MRVIMERQPEPTPTRESDFDHELAVTTFDYCIDQYHKGKLTYEEAIQAYTEVMLDMTTQDQANG